MNEATRQFALAHADDDVRQLALKGCKDAAVDLAMALQQISGRQTARRKVPSWAAIDDIRYPVHLSMEQCSSEATALYKVRLVDMAIGGGIPCRKLVDLTGGLGVDFAFLCTLFEEGVYVERDKELYAIAHHNFQVLGQMGLLKPLGLPGQLRQIGTPTVSVVCAEAEGFLHNLEEHVTMIFVDPARRDSRGARTYGIGDCTPNVLPLMDELLRKADYVMLKLSPMLDWRKAVNDVGSERVEQVHIVATGGECKELLLLLSAKGSKQQLLVCSNDGHQETFLLKAGAAGANETTQNTSLSQQPHFLYEPHAALMKGGFFAEIAQRYTVSQLSLNSHLFLSNTLVEGFPGRTFRIKAVSTMNKQELKEKVLPLKQANISVRNFPMTADVLRKKLKLSEGGDNYLFATTLADGRHIILVCQKHTV